MFYHQHGQTTLKSSSALQKRQQTTIRPAPQAKATHPATLIQRAKLNPNSLNADDVLTLQGTIGNRAANRLLASRSATQVQAKLTIGEPGDKYEQEADRVASQVVEQLHAPASAESAQGQSVQRQDIDDEELQAKHEITALQRQDIDDEELQAKPSSSDLQRVPLSPEVQQEAMLDDDLQAKSILQHQEGVAVGEASTDLESSINRARGSGQPLDTGLQQSMGQAMGADFRGVRVHTDSKSDQLNQSIQAKAFTTGQDMFFRQGEYNPGSRGGQELIAHELTHVVQQGGGQLSLQRKEILNLASGTKIENLMMGNTLGDNVINLDRGDMIDTQFILHHYEKFQTKIDEDVSLPEEEFVKKAKQRLKAEDGDERIPEQIKKEKVNFWFYEILKGNIDKLEKIINETMGSPSHLAKEKLEVLEAEKGFMFGDISPQMKFINERFDEIRMVSGYGIPILKDEDYTREMARMLKADGVLIITGNRGVLTSNGIKLDKKRTNLVFPNFLENYFEFKGVDANKAGEVGSEHTLGGEFEAEEEFYTFTFQKK